jgi:hypothetical protein
MWTDARTHPNAILLAGALMLVTADTHPQSSGGNYRVAAHALDAGGRSGAGIYRVNGVIGQAAVTRSTAGSYAVAGGFLPAQAPLPDAIFANGFE